MMEILILWVLSWIPVNPAQPANPADSGGVVQSMDFPGEFSQSGSERKGELDPDA